jgi:hypothetical protein
MTIDIAELFARRERERDAPPRQNPTSHSGPNFIPRKVAFGHFRPRRGQPQVPPCPLCPQKRK